MHTVQIAQWGTVYLIGLIREDDDPPTVERAQLAFLFNDAEIWPASAILSNLVLRTNMRYVRASGASNATLAGSERLRQWAAETLSVAADVRTVYGDRIAEVMTGAANDVNSAIQWPERRLEKVPTTAKGRADLYIAIELWAFDQVRTAMEAVSPGVKRNLPGRDAGRTQLLQHALRQVEDAGQPIMKSDEGWKMRVRRLRVRAGEESNLVADVLDTCRSGPFDRNGNQTNRDL